MQVLSVALSEWPAAHVESHLPAPCDEQPDVHCASHSTEPAAVAALLPWRPASTQMLHRTLSHERHSQKVTYKLALHHWSHSLTHPHHLLYE